MWPLEVSWQALQFGVEIEFIGGDPEQVELLPGWIMALDERQTDETGEESGSELKPPPLRWEHRGQIREMLRRLLAQGARVNWNCGLHVHVGLEPWGHDIIVPLLEAAIMCQDALRTLLETGEHRMLFCPPVTEEMIGRYKANQVQATLRRSGRPQAHRCGINAAAWHDIGTVEIRYANGSLDYAEVMNTIELCLRFIAAIGSGRTLPQNAAGLAQALGAQTGGYPPAVSAPRWFRERVWLEEMLLPIFTPIIASLMPDGEILRIVPVEGAVSVMAEDSDGKLRDFAFRPTAEGWKACR